jgi:hypothetical protein
MNSNWKSKAIGVLLRSCVIAAILLLISLAFNSTKETGWLATGQFDITVKQATMGFPPWLVFNQARVQGNAPPFDSRWLPEADDYRPGFHIHLANFVLAASGALVLSLVFCGIWEVPFHGKVKLKKGTLALGYGIPIPLAIGAVIILPKEPNWIAVSAQLTLISAGIITSAAIMRSYRHALLASLLIFLAIWWTSRVIQSSGWNNATLAPPEMDDLLMTAVCWPAFLIVYLVVTLISRFLVNRINKEKACCSTPAI